MEPDREARVGASLPYRKNSGTHLVTGGASSSSAIFERGRERSNSPEGFKVPTHLIAGIERPQSAKAR